MAADSAPAADPSAAERRPPCGVPTADSRSAAPTRGGRAQPTKGRAHALAALLLAALALISLVGLRLESPTMDEPNHLVRGLAYWWQGDTRLSYAHPPLADALMALPVAITEPAVDLSALPGWDQAQVEVLAREYMVEDFGRARRQILLARHVPVVFCLLLGLYLYLFCSSLYDRRVALWALGLYCFHPTLFAHGRLVTTDMAVALASTVAVGEAAKHFTRPRWSTLLRVAVAVGAALSVKYSAAYLIPLLLGLGLLFAYGGGAAGEASTRRRRILRVVGQAAFVGAVSLLMVNGAYRFQRSGWTVAHMLAEPEPRNWISKREDQRLLEERSPLRYLPASLPVPLPYSYVFGLATVSVQNSDGHSSYFMGMRRKSGWMAYFPMMLLIKSPLAVILLLGVGLWRTGPRTEPTKRATTVLLIALALFLSFALASRINIGVRHVLPIMPLMVVLAALVATALWQGAERRWLRPAMMWLGAATVISGFAWLRHPLGYFNALCAGPIGGLKISVIGEDWGQDVVDLAAAVTAGGYQPLHYHYYGYTTGLELAHDGVPFEPMRCHDPEPAGPGFAAVHLATLARLPGCYPWLIDREPIAKVNRRIYVFRLADRPQAPPRPRTSAEPIEEETVEY